jgi:hypothetical protein
MEPEIKNCQDCKKDFTIRAEDKIFYSQMNSPFPNYCPDCRMMHRLVFRNERTFYKRPCDLCKTDMITVYSPESPYTVYCHTCWWSDNWDPKSFGREYDLSRSFFDQYQELQREVPRLSLMAFNNVRSEYTNGSAENKDCYLIFAADYNEDCLYGRLLQRDKQCVDCAFLHESELCYECLDSRNCFKCMFSEQCQSSSELLFCYNMRDSQNCIFCTNGRHMSNSIHNIKYSKEEFEAKKKEILASHESIEAAKKEFEKIKGQTLKKFSSQTKCNNVTGDYIHNCHDGVLLFDTYDAKNCSYMTDTESPIDSMDCNNYYYKPSFGYNIMGALEGSKLKNSAFVFYCNEVEYCESCYHLSNALGCVAIRKGNYMILNREYSKEEYLELKKKIDEQMKTDPEYGQFFPARVAPFTYNEALSQDFYPLTKEVASERGFNWREMNTGTFGKETIKIADMPETIEEVTDDILKETLLCDTCGKNFRLIQAELEFYRKMHLPIPHQDFECRHQARMSKRNPRKLWSRSCMCSQDGHDHVGACPSNFESSYSPEKQDVVYCEGCYQKEVA